MGRDHEITKEPEYEAEVRKQYEKLNYRISYGWEHNNPGKDYFLMNDLWWKVLGIFAIFVPIYMNYMPDCLGKDETWYRKGVKNVKNVKINKLYVFLPSFL